MLSPAIRHVLLSLSFVLILSGLGVTPRAQAQAPSSQEEQIRQRLNDLTVEARVIQALQQDQTLEAYVFSVRVSAGVVYLEGSVDSQAHRTRAERVASRTRGVAGIENSVYAPDVPAVPASSSDKAADVAPASYHVVRSGESLWIIARRYDTSIDTLQRINDLSTSRLQVGQRLRVR